MRGALVMPCLYSGSEDFGLGGEGDTLNEQMATEGGVTGVYTDKSFNPLRKMPGICEGETQILLYRVPNEGVVCSRPREDNERTQGLTMPACAAYELVLPAEVGAEELGDWPLFALARRYLSW